MTRRALTLLALSAVAVALLAASVWGALALLDGLGGFWYASWRVLFGAPLSLQRVLMGLAVLTVFVGLALTPLAWLERRADRAFALEEETLRRAHPDAPVEAYEGDEGVGVAFDLPEARVLLLRPAARVGAPRLVRQARPDAMPPPDERTSTTLS